MSLDLHRALRGLRAALVACAVGLAGAGASARDLGTYGPVYAIQEPDMLDAIKGAICAGA